MAWEEAFGEYVEQAYEIKEARANFRTEIWMTKDGREIAIRDMDNRHLFNAYRYSQDSLLFREMVLRLFENKLKEKT